MIPYHVKWAPIFIFETDWIDGYLCLQNWCYFPKMEIWPFAMKAKQAGRLAKTKFQFLFSLKKKKKKPNQETSFFIFHEQLKLMDKLSVILEFSRILQYKNGSWKLEVGSWNRTLPRSKKKKKNRKILLFIGEVQRNKFWSFLGSVK